MKCHDTFDEYLRNPIGGYTVGQNHLAWCHSTRLSGMTFWGRLEPQHATYLKRAQRMDTDGVGGLSLIDLRRVESIDETALDSLADCLSGQAPMPCAPAVALLRPEGFLGAAVAGLCRVCDFSCPVEVFTDPRDALTWLGAADASEVIIELDDVLGTFVGGAAVLRALRIHLGRNPGKVDLTTACAAVGMSRRALQRKLQEAHTSFQAEHATAQIQFAKGLLRDTNLAIKRIAFEVGCSSLAAFSALFRRVEGQSPSSWRSQAVHMHQARRQQGI
jgi:AraC-like DNA-binding protein